MGTTTHTHNGHSAQCGRIHYGYIYYGIELPKVGTPIMSMFVIVVPNMSISILDVSSMSAPILSGVKMGVSILGTPIKTYPIEGTSILDGAGLFGVLAGFAPTNRIFVGT